MKKYQVIILYFVLFSIVSCDKSNNKESDGRPHFVVYKTRVDYRNNAFVCISGGKITAMTDHFKPSDTARIFKMGNGYYLDSWTNYGLNTAYLSLTREEYNKMGLDSSTVKKFIMDTNPYIELYSDDNYILGGAVYSSNTSAVDTALLRQIIQNNELSTKLKRIK